MKLQYQAMSTEKWVMSYPVTVGPIETKICVVGIYVHLTISFGQCS